MLLETLSTPLNKALANGNSYASAYQTPGLFVIQPSGDEPSGDGYFSSGQGGQVAPNRLKIFAYGKGNPGNAFTFRVYGWNVLPGESYTQVWVPYLLAEFQASLGQIPGPPSAVPGRPSGRLILESEYLADGLLLVQGQLGMGGFISGTAPGLGLPAYALLDLAGCQKFSFDFQQGGGGDDVGMNCLWARA